MDAIIGFFASLDPLAVLFLAGSLLSLWTIARVLIDDLELGESEPEEATAERPAPAGGGAVSSGAAEPQPTRPGPAGSPGRRRAA